jgi:hypothetical protein
MKADTFFLFCLTDINKLQVYYNNIIDILISLIFSTFNKRNKLIILLVIQRFKHLFFI